MVENAQMFTQDQVNTFLGILGVLVLSNIGQIISGTVRYIRKEQKESTDIKAAHEKIRELTKRLETLEKEKKP